MSRTTNYATGLGAEALAAFFLRLKGYRILGKRVRTPLGEIDLLAEKGRTLVVVEVKSRRSLEDAACAVSEKQWMRLYRAVSFFLAHSPRHTAHTVRFDALLFGQNRPVLRFIPRHILDAWRPPFQL